MDALDQNKAINKAGRLVGKLKPVDNAPKKEALQARAPEPQPRPRSALPGGSQPILHNPHPHCIFLTRLPRYSRTLRCLT